MTMRNYWLAVLAMFAPMAAFGAEGAMADGAGLMGLGVGLGIAIAVYAASTAQGKIASSFMEGISRNPGAADVLRTPLILSLVFVETLVLFTVLIVIMLMGKI